MTSDTSFQLVDNHGNRYPLGRQQTRLGRSSDNQIVVQDSQASRHHATIFAQAGQFYIQDEGSTNGTRLNGTRVAGPQPIHIGDRIRIGTTEFVVQPGVAAPAQPMRGGYAAPTRQSSALPYVAVGGVAAATIVFLIVAIALSAPRPVSQAQLVPSPVISSPVVPSQVIPTPIPPTVSIPSPLAPSPTRILATLIPSIEPPTDGAVLVPLDADANRILAAIVEMIRASGYLQPRQVRPDDALKISSLGFQNPDVCVDGPGRCCCGTYAAYKLFGPGKKALKGSWPTADSMDDPNYWTKEDVVGKDNLREPKDDAQSGDIVIMRANSNIYWVTDPAHPLLDDFHKWKLGSDGHIGFVMEATYRSDLNGWVIKMRSANWGFNSPVAKLNEATCSDVTDAYIFVRNFEQVHFWRKMPPTPEPPPLPPPPPVPVPVPTPVPACVAPPTLFDPPDGRTFWARNTVLRWRNYDLKQGEYFDVQVWPDGGGIKSLGGAISYKNGEWSLPIDDLYAWSLGKYFWKVRVKASDGSYRSCDSNPFSFTLIEKNQPAPSLPGPSSPSSNPSSSGFCFYGCTPLGQCYWQCN